MSLFFTFSYFLRSQLYFVLVYVNLNFYLYIVIQQIKQLLNHFTFLISFLKVPDNEIQTKYGKKLINPDLSQDAKERIKAAINANEGKIKASFTVTINDRAAGMRIDMAAPIGRQGAHAGADVPHAQVSPFVMTRMVRGEERLVPFTSSFDAIELSSQMVLDTFSEDGTTADIAAGSDLYGAIKTKIGEQAMNRGWKQLLWSTGEDEPPNMEIQFVAFSSGFQ